MLDGGIYLRAPALLGFRFTVTTMIRNKVVQDLKKQSSLIMSLFSYKLAEEKSPLRDSESVNCQFCR